MLLLVRSKDIQYLNAPAPMQEHIESLNPPDDQFLEFLSAIGSLSTMDQPTVDWDAMYMFQTLPDTGESP